MLTLVNETEGKALLISKYSLDAKPYNEKKTDVTWETCTLRSWLNGELLSSAFSEEEQGQIVKTKVTADKNPKYSTTPGNDTEDKVFLLSLAEAEKYFTSNAARQCEATAFAKGNGVAVADNGNSWWWLRSPGNTSRSAAGVYADGSLNCYGRSVNRSNNAVRPALWISLS